MIDWCVPLSNPQASPVGDAEMIAYLELDSPAPEPVVVFTFAADPASAEEASRDETGNRGVFIEMTAGTDAVITIRYRERHAVFHRASDEEHRRECLAFVDALKISRNVLLIIRQ